MGMAVVYTKGDWRSMQKDQWNITVKHPSAIDYQEILESTSREYPVALVSIESADYALLGIHRTLHGKAFTCKKSKKLRQKFYSLVELIDSGFCKVPMENISKVLEILKEIKRAPYKKPETLQVKVNLMKL